MTATQAFVIDECETIYIYISKYVVSGSVIPAIAIAHADYFTNAAMRYDAPVKKYFL